jgi:hypothetical protein
MTHRLALAVAALALACTARETKTVDSATSMAAPNVVTVIARDFAFAAPDTIPAGVTTIRLVSEGPNLHHAQLIRLDQGKTFADFSAALRAAKPTDPPPAWAIPVGGPNPPAPGEEASTTQMLEPGNYALVCFVDTPDKVPHVMKGMSRALVVVPSTATTAEPTPTATMQLVDYGFNTTPPLTAGKQTIRVENAAQQPHEVFVARLDSGKTTQDLLKWLDKMEGAPPAKPLGGVAFIAPGSHVFLPLDLAPGDYALICFVPDAKDGKPHFMHGMATQIKVS